MESLWNLMLSPRKMGLGCAGGQETEFPPVSPNTEGALAGVSGKEKVTLLVLNPLLTEGRETLDYSLCLHVLFP